MSDPKRIAWLDSVDMASHIHVTTDGGLTTACGHEPGKKVKEGRWKITHHTNIPRRHFGFNNYCGTCFKKLKCKKSIPWTPEMMKGERSEHG